MSTRTASAIVAATLVLSACGSAAGPVPTTGTSASAIPSSPEQTAPEKSAVASAPSTEPSEPPAPFPVETFAAISDEPVPEALAAEFQAALEDLAIRDEFVEHGGMTATVMTADGTWSGAVGKADAVRDLRIDDQFAIASITKSVVAAQVMLMVEAGELDLDGPAIDHLPPDLEFDSNGATIRELLSHRSGIPDNYEVLEVPARSDPLRAWQPTEVMELVPAERADAGRSFEYAEINYLLLGQMIEHVRGRPLGDVLREGVLGIDGVERLVYQPDEAPAEPMAMPGGQSTAVLDLLGGYLPSLSSVTAFPGASGLASDSPSLARWWRAFCAGQIVSPESLNDMAAFDPDGLSLDGAYGLGLFNPAHGYTRGTVGHQGELFGYMSWAACLPEEGAVMVVLTNRPVSSMTIELFYGALRPFVDVLR